MNENTPQQINANYNAKAMLNANGDVMTLYGGCSTAFWPQSPSYKTKKEFLRETFPLHFIATDSYQFFIDRKNVSYSPSYL